MHADVIHSISIWAKEYGLENRVSLLVDHGSVPSGYYVKEKGLCVIFAGKKLKADDIIGMYVLYATNIHFLSYQTIHCSLLSR